jgi:hypothetical protein
VFSTRGCREVDSIIIITVIQIHITSETKEESTDEYSIARKLVLRAVAFPIDGSKVER